MSKPKSPIKKASLNGSNYIVVDHFDGQHCSNINGLLSLQCWLASSNLSSKVLIVEPVITDTKFHMPYSLTSDVSSTLKFSDFFDLEYFNDASNAVGYPSLATLDDFYTFASKNMTYVKTYNPNAPHSHVHDLNAKMKWSAKGKDCGAWNRLANNHIFQSKAFCIKHIMNAPLGFFGQTFSPLNIFSHEDISHKETILIQHWDSLFTQKIHNANVCHILQTRSSYVQVQR